MLDHSKSSWIRAARPLAFLSLVAVLLVVLGSAVLPWEQMFPDAICYFAAGKILASGQSPYDADLQTAVQHEYGWEKATTGFGIYDFLPYYYPPWFGLAWVLLVPLGFSVAKMVWFFINIELTLVSGYLLKQSVPGVPPWMPIVLAPIFAFSFACILLGQTAIVVLFLMVLAWHLLELRQDWAAGAVLAWLTMKPQLTAVLLLAVLLWAVRQRRWGVAGAFAATLAVLSLGSALLLPDWPQLMWNATKEIPSPTEFFPWIGNSWLLVLRSFGLHGWVLWFLYLAVAGPFLATVVRAAWKRDTPLANLFALAVLAAFFVSPYARHYDFPVLLIPLLVLLGTRRPEWVGAAVMIAVVVVPYLQLIPLVYWKPLYNPDGKFLLEITYFWVPFVLAGAWLTTDAVTEHEPCLNHEQ